MDCIYYIIGSSDISKILSYKKLTSTNAKAQYPC